MIQRLGPGTIIMSYLASKGIRAHEGCLCGQLAAEMDQLGPTGCRAEIERLTGDMAASVRQWRQLEGGIWRIIAHPPRAALRGLILWACDEAERLGCTNDQLGEMADAGK